MRPTMLFAVVSFVILATSPAFAERLCRGDECIRVHQQEHRSNGWTTERRFFHDRDFHRHNNDMEIRVR